MLTGRSAPPPRSCGAVGAVCADCDAQPLTECRPPRRRRSGTCRGGLFSHRPSLRRTEWDERAPFTIHPRPPRCRSHQLRARGASPVNHVAGPGRCCSLSAMCFLLRPASPRLSRCDRALPSPWQDPASARLFAPVPHPSRSLPIARRAGTASPRHRTLCVDLHSSSRVMSCPRRACWSRSILRGSFLPSSLPAIVWPMDK